MFERCRKDIYRECVPDPEDELCRYCLVFDRITEKRAEEYMEPEDYCYG